MKILAIRGRNLASLEEEFEIDFTREPLCSAGIFAITGQTGAGKSTLLDALCLALFDDAPRLDKAETLKIENENSDNITLRDSRNILRKGASEGYAGTDFVALDGQRYRSTWTVRRARGKTDGTLQNVNIKLENLSTGREEQGTRKELLAKITELIGLSFDQFTRAVLLAQGDFATFLKARQSEKAELLEKLTGTGIYSAVSILIYQKTEEAGLALHLVEERMKGVSLLKEEESASFLQEKEKTEKQLESLGKRKADADKQSAWFEEDEHLRTEISSAEKELNETEQKIAGFASRYRYVSLLDLSETVRDDYFKRKEKKEQYERVLSDIERSETEEKEMKVSYAELNVFLDSAQKNIDELQKKYRLVRPEIEKAKELDFKIESIGEKLKEENEELEKEREKKRECEQNILRFKTQEEKSRRKITVLEKWFADHKEYRSIVSETEILVTFLDNARTIKEQKENVENSLKACKASLESQGKRLTEVEKEEKRLNELLPAEILELRKKLEEGSPCPVCGSIHHPYSPTGRLPEGKGIEEKELQKEKEKNSEEKESLKAGIEKTEKSLTSFETLIRGYAEQYDDLYGKIKKELHFIPEWEKRMQQNTLQKELRTFQNGWNRKEEEEEREKRETEKLRIRQEAENKTFATIGETLKNKEEVFRISSESFKKCKEERKSLLGGKSVGETEKYYTEAIEKCNKNLVKLKKEKDVAETKKAGLKGKIDQLKKNKESMEKEIFSLDKTIEEWLEKEGKPVGRKLLEELMGRSKEWIKEEKKFLEELKNQKLIDLATFKERQAKASKHQESKDKPGPGQTKENLRKLAEETGKQIEDYGKRLNEIDYFLRLHAEGKEKIKAFEKEKDEKKQLYEDWAKLNALLGSANGNKFKTIAQGYTLDVLLGYANKHLKELSPRYRLEKIPNTLALQVIDNDMLGEVRPVNSLSGGESFLLSLSLALGLSSLSSNRMHIESLFIDEGFGSLDTETLNIAMDALDLLQTQGRKIGVISHVEEMKERIRTQIQVIRQNNGKSTIRIADR